MSSREQVAQAGPPPSLEGFPVHALTPETALFRAHLAARGPWWFGSDGSGRFDLPAPRGACYVAQDPASAVRERVGPVLAAARAVPESLLEDVVVSRLSLGWTAGITWVGASSAVSSSSKMESPRSSVIFPSQVEVQRLQSDSLPASGE